MSTFLFAYRAPKGYIPGEPDVAGAWNAWFAAMGSDVLVDVGNPIFRRESVGSPAADTELGGYSLVNADDIEAAVALVKGCPMISAGGAVEVGEITPLSPEGIVTTVEDHARASNLAG